MTTWTQDITVKRESRRWIQMMSKYQNNIMWVVIPCGNWQKIREERMMIFRIIQVMVSPTKKGEEKTKNKNSYGVWGEERQRRWGQFGCEELRMPLTSNCRCWADSWEYGARPQRQGQQKGNVTESKLALLTAWQANKLGVEVLR